MTSDEVYKLIEANGLTLHGDIEHFAALVIANHPPQRKPLTDEEISRLWSQSLADTEGETYLPLNEFARAIEAKLKEKNT